MKMKNIATLALMSSVSVSAAETVNTVGVNLRDYEGEVKFVLDSSAGAGADNTLDVKLQESADNATWTDVVGGAFIQVTNAAVAHEEIQMNIDARKAYVRVVRTSAGAGIGFAASVCLVGQKKYS